MEKPAVAQYLRQIGVSEKDIEIFLKPNSPNRLSSNSRCQRLIRHKSRRQFQTEQKLNKIVANVQIVDR